MCSGAWSVAGHYMYLDSSRGTPGDQVALLSPLISVAQPKQLQFYYNMFVNEDDTSTALTLYMFSQLHTYERQLLTMSGDYGDSWQLATVCLPVGNYSLAFVGTIGVTYLSDLAIDDISFTTNPCSPQTFVHTTG